MSKEIERLSEDVYEDMLMLVEPTEDSQFIDPITIIMIVGIIINIIRVIQECRKNKTKDYSFNEVSDYLSEDIKIQSVNSGFLTRWRIKRIIKKHLTPEQYSYYGTALLNSIIYNGQKIDSRVVKEALEIIDQ